MPRQPSRRERIAAIAATAEYNPEEAANAAAILATLPRDLDAIADDIRAAWGNGLDAQFAIGRLLAEARAEFPADEAFGQWFAAKDFAFSRQVAWRLRAASEREPEVRAFIAARSDSYKSRTRDMTVHTAITLMNSKPKAPVARVGIPEPTDPTFTAFRAGAYAVLGWEVDEVGNGGPTSNAFLSMHTDDLRESALLLQELVRAYQAARAAVTA